MSLQVLLLSPTAAPGGAERALVSLARQLGAIGVAHSAVLLSDGPLTGWLRDAGCPVTIVKHGRTRELRRTTNTVRELVDLAANADIVVSNQSKGHIYGGLAAWRAGVPEIWWQHGTPSLSAIEGVAASVPGSAVVCVSQTGAQAQRRLTRTRRIEVIHPGIPISHVRSYRGSGKDIRASLGWEGHTVIGIVGRLQPWKGQEVFLRAAAAVAPDHPEAIFAIIGGPVLGWEGDYEEHLRQLSRDLDVAGVTRFVGHQDDVYPWFDALDVAVHASADEPFGLVLLEAMALGKPLIATGSGGPVEITEDGASAVLVAVGDVPGLASAINAVVSQPDLAGSLRVAGERRVEAFSEERMADRFVELIINTCDAGRRPRRALRAGASEKRTRS